MRRSGGRSVMLCLGVATLLCGAASRDVRDTFDAARFGRAVDAFVKPLLARGDLSGQLLVARHGQVVLERSYGWANAELRVPMTPESRLCVASVTKPMTVQIAFRLMAERRIGYRDSIARWLPDFPHANEIRIEHLLRHSSGIPHELEPDSVATHVRTAADMVRIAAALPLDFPPGSKSSYSSGGFSVLARILELASGESYEALLERAVFAPAGMTQSRHADAVELLPGRVEAYVPGPHGHENATFQDFSGIVGAGSVWSTARDIHRFVRAVLSGTYGTVTRQSWVRGGKLDFNGRTGGFRAFAVWDSSSDLEIVFLGNVISGAPDLLKDAVSTLAAGGTPSPIALPAVDTTAVEPARLAHAVGDFRLENGTPLRLRVRDGVLWCNDWVLLPAAGGGFFSPRDYGLVRPVDGPDGTVARLDWTQNGQTYPAKCTLGGSLP